MQQENYITNSQSNKLTIWTFSVQQMLTFWVAKQNCWHVKPFKYNSKWSNTNKNDAITGKSLCLHRIALQNMKGSHYMNSTVGNHTHFYGIIAVKIVLDFALCNFDCYLYNYSIIALKCVYTPTLNIQTYKPNSTLKIY